MFNLNITFKGLQGISVFSFFALCFKQVYNWLSVSRNCWESLSSVEVLLPNSHLSRHLITSYPLFTCTAQPFFFCGYFSFSSKPAEPVQSQITLLYLETWSKVRSPNRPAFLLRAAGHDMYWGKKTHFPNRTENRFRDLFKYLSQVD